VADQDEPRASAYDSLPAVRVTASQLVAWNLARFRQAAGLQQDELGARLGWSGKKVSAMETSWKGAKTRQFEVSAVVALAAALRVPAAAFLLPPDDDGVACRYVLAGPDGQEDLSMAALVTYLIPDGCTR
jgi:transcriptional regulator with XRE-family HTH domain